MSARASFSQFPSPIGFPRSGNSCVEYKGRVYSFFGTTNDTYHNSVHIITESVVSAIPLAGDLPPPREYQSACAINDQIWIYGGCGNQQVYGDVWSFDPSTQTWAPHECISHIIPLPTPRSGHGAVPVVVNSSPKMFVFGGLKGADTTSEALFFDPETLCWSCAALSGEAPSGRQQHTMNVWGNKVIIFGGIDGTGQVLADLHILNLETMTWSSPMCGGEVPLGRYGHASLLFRDQLVVFGGMSDEEPFNDAFALDLVSRNWHRLECDGLVPSPRHNHTLTVIAQSPGSTTALLCGGLAEDGSCEDRLFLFSLEDDHVPPPPQQLHPTPVAAPPPATLPQVDTPAASRTVEPAVATATPAPQREGQPAQGVAPSLDSQTPKVDDPVPRPDLHPVDGTGTAVSSAGRLRVKTRPRWMDDSEASVCQLCGRGFGILTRKHHCRSCGRIFCAKCCSAIVPLPELGYPEPVRVCQSCRDSLGS
ncbi:putative tip elongation aberrant protein 1 [Paratrimastix pyriformis]|uniref:Tip elongation aberrant protein 1 n=1 Tax=Paratrimastix pyriformis TaxID=342808 RepID=A0ABQ8UDT9_9EUKA|nr:putative tip elongation aberrant protein 1 [Paratrimastix pyriformis]